MLVVLVAAVVKVAVCPAQVVKSVGWVVMMMEAPLVTVNGNMLKAVTHPI